MDQPAPLGLQVQRVLKAPLVHKVPLATPAPQGRLALRDPLVLPVLPDPPDRQALPERPAQQAQRGQRGQLDPRVARDQLGLPVLQVLLERPGQRVQQEQPDQSVLPDPQVLPDLPGRRGRDSMMSVNSVKEPTIRSELCYSMTAHYIKLTQMILREHQAHPAILIW